MDQQGIFNSSTYIFPGRFNYTECTLISNNILTKGYYPAALAFAEAANKLFLSNTMTVTYTLEQKLQYLNSPFFMDNLRITDYLNILYDCLWKILPLDFERFVTYYKQALILPAVILIVIILLLLILAPILFKNGMQKDIKEMRTGLSLLTFRSTMDDPQLRQQFVEGM